MLAVYGGQDIVLPDETRRAIAELVNGDARRALNTLEMMADMAEVDDSGKRVLKPELLTEIAGERSARFDNKGDRFYDLISALHKSVRGSAPDAALYWYARIITAGGDPLYVARRCLAIASEDVGNADPRAMQVAIASGGERLLFKISGPMVVVKVGIIVVFGFAMIPHWNFANITAFPQASVFFRDVLLTIPFCFFSAVFIQVLNPMNIAYRKREADKVLATRLALRTHRISYVTLIAVILFFAFSFTFSISHEEAVSAFEQNISALALAAQVIPGHIIHITSTVLNIFAVLTAFFGIYLGFHEAIKGIILNLLSRIIDTKKINSRVLTLAICAFIVITLTIWVSFRVSVLVFFQLGSPLYGIVSCLIPFFLIYKVAQLEKLRGFKAWLILLYGILLCLSPLLKLIE